MLASPAQSASCPPSRNFSILLPLALDSVTAIHLQHLNQVVQVSLRADKDEKEHEDLVRLYRDVEQDITDLIAFILHSSSLDHLPELLDGGEKGYHLTCKRQPPSKTLSRWTWTKGGVEIGPAPYKYSFVFSRRRKGQQEVG